MEWYIDAQRIVLGIKGVLSVRQNRKLRKMWWCCTNEDIPVHIGKATADACVG